MSSLEGMVRARMGGTTPWQGLRAATMHPWRGWTSRPERGERHHGGVVSRPPCEMQLKRVASGAACGDVVFSAAAPPCVRLLAWARGSLGYPRPPRSRRRHLAWRAGGADEIGSPVCFLGWWAFLEGAPSLSAPAKAQQRINRPVVWYPCGSIWRRPARHPWCGIHVGVSRGPVRHAVWYPCGRRRLPPVRGRGGGRRCAW